MRERKSRSRERKSSWWFSTPSSSDSLPFCFFSYRSPPLLTLTVFFLFFPFSSGCFTRQAWIFPEMSAEVWFWVSSSLCRCLFFILFFCNFFWLFMWFFFSSFFFFHFNVLVWMMLKASVKLHLLFWKISLFGVFFFFLLVVLLGSVKEVLRKFCGMFGCREKRRKFGV